MELVGPSPTYLAADYHSYASVYSVDASGDLHTTFLPSIGGTWQTQNLFATYPIPLTVSPIPPSTLMSYDADGGLTVNNVFTINEFNQSSEPPNGTVQHSFLPRIGDAWSSVTIAANLTR